MNIDKQFADALLRVHTLIDAQAIVKTTAFMLSSDEQFHKLDLKWNFPARSTAQLRRRQQERARRLMNQISFG